MIRTSSPNALRASAVSPRLGARFHWLRAAVVAVAALVAACSRAYIPNTDVEDTGENRKVVLFCEEYRHAVEDKNIGKLLALASPRYHEDGGNTRGEDDIDYDGLKQYLAGVFMKTTGIRYEIKYRRVTFKEDKHVLVDYTYAASYRLPGVKQEEWRHTVADNRLELVPDGDTYKILGGM
jgi:hypothetical protein